MSRAGFAAARSGCGCPRRRSTGLSIEPLPRYQDSDDAHEAEKQPLPTSEVEHASPPVKGRAESTRTNTGVLQSEAPGVNRECLERASQLKDGKSAASGLPKDDWPGQPATL